MRFKATLMSIEFASGNASEAAPAADSNDIRSNEATTTAPALTDGFHVFDEDDLKKGKGSDA